MDLDLRNDKFRAKAVIERTPWFAVLGNNDCASRRNRAII